MALGGLYRWDEWVQPSRLLKYNETNVALQKALQSQASASQGASSAAAAKGATKTSSMKDATRVGRKDGGRGTKRGREEVRRALVCLALVADNTACRMTTASGRR